jgi:hypothetical protein
MNRILPTIPEPGDEHLFKQVLEQGHNIKQ